MCPATSCPLSLLDSAQRSCPLRWTWWKPDLLTLHQDSTQVCPTARWWCSPRKGRQLFSKGRMCSSLSTMWCSGILCATGGHLIWTIDSWPDLEWAVYWVSTFLCHKSLQYTNSTVSENLKAVIVKSSQAWSAAHSRLTACPLVSIYWVRGEGGGELFFNGYRDSVWDGDGEW